MMKKSSRFLFKLSISFVLDLTFARKVLFELFESIGRFSHTAHFKDARFNRKSSSVKIE